MNLWRIPAPAPCARTRQTCASLGRISKPETGPAFSPATNKKSFAAVLLMRRARYILSALALLRCSFQPVTRYQSAMRITTIQAALGHPTIYGRNDAEPN